MTGVKAVGMCGSLDIGEVRLASVRQAVRLGAERVLDLPRRPGEADRHAVRRSAADGQAV